MKEKKRNCIYAKKALVPILALVLILTATLLPIGVGPPGIFAYADDAAKISLVKVSEDTLNDTVVLKVNLDTVPAGGISLVEFKVKYPEEFEITKSEVLELMGTGEDQYVIKGQTTANPYYVAQASLVQNDDGVYEGDGGGIIRLTFTPKDTATLTDGTGYTFTLQDVKAYRLDADATSSSIEGTSIEIASDCVTTYTYKPVADNHSGEVTSSSVTVTQPEAASGETTPVVKTQTIREAITKADESSKETITLNAADSSSIALTKTAAKAIATQKDESGETSASGKSLDIQMSTSELSFDSTAVTSIGNKSGGEKLVIETERIEDREIVTGDAVDALKYEVTAKLVGVDENNQTTETPVTSFGGGEVTVSLDLPSSWSEQDRENLICWNYTDTNYTVVKGYLKTVISGDERNYQYEFKTKHFSHYIVAKQTTLNVFNKVANRTEGVTVSGTITSYGNKDDEVTLTLTDENSAEILTLDKGEISTTGKCYTQTYTFTGVPNGNYTLTIAKKGHAPIEKEIIVSGTAISGEDAIIYLWGDVTGDGSVTAADAQQVKRYVAKVTSAYDNSANKSYWIVLANVTRDTDSNGAENVTAADAQQIQRYVAKISSALDALIN